MTFVKYKSREQKILLEVINKFGCIHKEQIYELFKSMPKEKIDLQVIHFLISRKIIRCIDNKYYVNATNSSLNKDSINLLWAMLQIASKPEEISNALIGSEPADYYMTRQKSESYQIMLLNEGNLIRLRTLQEYIDTRNKMTQKTGIGFCSYVLVITSEKVFEKVKEYPFSIPLSVVYIREVSGQPKPNIRKFKKSPSLD